MFLHITGEDRVQPRRHDTPETENKEGSPLSDKRKVYSCWSQRSWGRLPINEDLGCRVGSMDEDYVIANGHKSPDCPIFSVPPSSVNVWSVLYRRTLRPWRRVLNSSRSSNFPQSPE